MWWRREKKEVAEFLYSLLVADTPKGYARQVAESMGVPYPTLSKYWLGKQRFPAALVKPLFLATNEDARVAEFFLLGGTDYRLERRREAAPLDDLSRATLLLGSLEAKISALYLDATSGDSEAGSRISRAERQRLVEATRRLIDHADKLRTTFETSDGS